MNIAIVTGAASGMGKSFALTIKDNIEVDEIWAIDKDKKGLEQLKKESSIKIKEIVLDLTKEESFKEYKKILEKEKPNIKILINAAGYGIFDSVKNTSYELNTGMIELNALGLTKMTILSLPYLKENSTIINFASMASFQPIPYIYIYAATKAYVLSFTRALKRELKKDKIKVMAVCPFWTKTHFFDTSITENEVVKKYVVMYKPEDVVKKAWKDLKKNKDYSAFGFVTKFQILLTKVLPHRFVMWYWMKQQKL